MCIFIYKEVSFVAWLLSWSHIAHKTMKDDTAYINYLPTLRALLSLQWLVNGKAIPLQAWTGPEGSRRLRLPYFKTIGT
jgi:hypothetical protein